MFDDNPKIDREVKSSNKLKLGRLEFMKPIIKLAFPNIEMPASLARILKEYLEAHREDILDKINDFGELYPVLFWFDNYLNFHADKVEYCQIYDPAEWPAVMTREEIELAKGLHDRPGDVETFRREYLGDWEPGGGRKELGSCPHCGCLHGAHSEKCSGLAGDAL